MRFILLSTVMFIAVTTVFAEGNKVTYQVAGKPYEGYFISPGANAPLILLIHDWDGLTEYEIRRANMLAELGYAVFAADLFGAGVRPTEVSDKRQHTGELYADRGKMRILMQGALSQAESSMGVDLQHTVAIGYCFGGAAVLELARSGAPLRGFVTFHGGLGIPDGQDYSATKGKVLVFHGTADTAISMDEFAGLGKQLEQFGIEHELISYGGAPHAFTVFGSDRYREDADRASWQRFTRFLQEIFSKQ